VKKTPSLILTVLVVVALGIGWGACSGDGNGDPDANGDECCPGHPEDEIFIYVQGTVRDLVTGQGLRAAIAPVSPMNALGSTNPPRILDMFSDADGTFETECFDVTRVELGIVMFCDDEADDGAEGTYYPVGTGVKSWLLADEKVCVLDTTVHAVPNELIQALNQLEDIDADADGVALGLVLDASGNPISGAQVTKGDGTALDKVYYPSADYQDLTSGTSTSASGFYAVPAASFGGARLVKNITASEGSRTFSENKSATVPGFGYFVEIVEQN